MCSANDAHTCYIDFHNLDFVNVTIDITKFIFTIITNINDVSPPHNMLSQDKQDPEAVGQDQGPGA